MLNVNKWLADALAAGGVDLDCSEEPMRKNVGDVPYITWEHGKITTDSASGQVYRRCHEVNMLIWVPAGEVLWQDMLQAVENALTQYKDVPGIECHNLEDVGALEAVAIGRKVVQLKLLVEDRRLWA